ncbi:acyclic terpene utilization AtuA family protein [Spongiibacter nanhainus]|uniref:DUF1446 domain-containing protein n=1 Tax=Spongiibacter nanhainus TaxID=2794344 RepID=A0A7T4R1T4_9GAMM|nr:acyclic terpene utilization AtuA family protein [Spongiibacter nanhainus]QQD18694.1 DUF1446 domain-containing protein [Spongiibacter nanhainus]
MNTNQKLRIGCASAFYGDSQLAARQLVDYGAIDYLVFDYLAEVTMAILANDKARDERLGFAVDFVNVAMKDVLADCARKGIKVIANAGGINVPGCIEALEKLCESQSLDLKIAGVYGDDLLDRKSELAGKGMPELQSGEPLPENLLSMNAYLGAQPIVKALAAGADVVVTGRVVDSAVVIAPLVEAFGWANDDYEKLSQAALAGHIIECGAQCTGGNFTDWQLVPDFSNMSYPVVEVCVDGSFEVQIPPGTGGLVTTATVGEQLVYEIGDPANYLLPDVACDWSGVELHTVGQNRVRVLGARGRAPGNAYKVCAIHADGYKLMGSFFMAGPRSREKARTSLEAWVKRTQRYFNMQGWAGYRGVSLEMIGSEDTYGSHSRAHDTREVIGKFGLHHDSRDALTFAANELAYLATSATPGMSGLGGGRARPTPLMRVHSTLINKDEVTVTVRLGNNVIEERYFAGDAESAVSEGQMYELSPAPTSNNIIEVPLETLAWARSGDKGDNANIGVIARKPEYLPYLYEQLTAEVVADYFSHCVRGEVQRFDLPGINGFNFFMTEALGGGGAGSLQIDPQGKAFAQMLLSKVIILPETMLE